MSAATSKSKIGRQFKDDSSLRRTKYFNCLDADYLEALTSLTKDIDLTMKVDQHADDNITLPTAEEDSISCITDDFYSGCENLQDKQNKNDKRQSKWMNSKQHSADNMHHRLQERSRETSRQIGREGQKKRGSYSNNRNFTDAIDLTNFVAPSFDFL